MILRSCLSNSLISRGLLFRKPNVNQSIIWNVKFFHRTPALANTKIENKYKAKDKIPDKFNLIYRAPMENYISTCKHFASFSALAIGAMTAFNYFTNTDMAVAPETIASLSMNDSDFIYYAAAFVMINAAISMVISRYTLRVYRQEKEYIAVFESLIPFRSKQMQFKQGAVKHVRGSSILPWNESQYKINNVNVLLISQYFKTPSELNKMLISNMEIK